MNSVNMIGNLGRDPRVRTTKSGKSVADLWLAVDSGKKSGEANWFNVTVWGDLADTVGKYLQKGSKIAIEGYLQSSRFTAGDGQTKYSVEVVADRIQFLAGIKSTEEQVPDAPTV